MSRNRAVSPSRGLLAGRIACNREPDPESLALDPGTIKGMDPDQFHRISKALANPRRFEILEHIACADGEAACSKLTSDSPLTQATISHHVKELVNAGLVKVRREAEFQLLSPPARCLGGVSDGDAAKGSCARA